MNSFLNLGGTAGNISLDGLRVSGESATRRTKFAARGRANQEQLTGKFKATFTPEECQILGRILNRFCNFLGVSSPLERRLIEKLRRLIAKRRSVELEEIEGLPSFDDL
jgi:hypothetical protein